MPQQEVLGAGSARRTFLAAVGSGLAATVAGCTGADGTTVQLQTGPEASAAYPGAQGIATVVQENTDELYVEARPTTGTEANVGALNNEESDIVYVPHWTAHEMVESVEPYDDLGFKPTQLFHFSDNIWFFGAGSEDYEHFSDITPETTVSPTVEGSGSAPPLEHALSHAVDEYERISVGYADQGSAIAEGRLDIGVGPYTNEALVPGFAQEMMGTADIHVLTASDDTLAAWEDDDRVLVGEFDGDVLENATYVPDVVQTPQLSYNCICRSNFDYDTVYAFLETLHENREALGDYAAIIEALEDEEFWTEFAFDGMPFHTAAADFYEEVGLWHDEFERAE